MTERLYAALAPFRDAASLGKHTEVEGPTED